MKPREAPQLHWENGSLITQLSDDAAVADAGGTGQPRAI